MLNRYYRAIILSLLFAGYASAAQLNFTKGMEGASTFTRNWSTKEVQNTNDYYNSAAIAATNLPTEDDIVNLGRDSGYNGGSYVKGTTDTMIVDGAYTILGLLQSAGSYKSTHISAGTYDDSKTGSLTFSSKTSAYNYAESRSMNGSLFYPQITQIKKIIKSAGWDIIKNSFKYLIHVIPKSF